MTENLETLDNKINPQNNANKIKSLRDKMRAKKKEVEEHKKE